MLKVMTRDISIALSGGGTRAMAFHAGLLKCMAENGVLGNVKNISTVSGGSLLVGLIFKLNDYKWPSSEEYIKYIYPRLRYELCTKSLMAKMAALLIKPCNFQYFLSRANLLSLAIQSLWDIKVPLSKLPGTPDWSINGTTAENGKRFRFKSTSIGDYETGYASADGILLADALSVSAAFPGGIGPFSLDVKNHTWMKKDWGAAEGCEEEVFLPTNKLRIYDGGVYDNLGLEPFFDQSNGRAKENIDFIICSDAGAPLKSGFSYWHLNPWRLKRVMDIISEQSRSLRVRTFVNYLIRNYSAGYYININNKENDDALNNGIRVGCYPTTLKIFTQEDFDAISSSGFNMMKRSFELY
ncbi:MULTISPECIES: patatin-like phospholipase family protein [Citrobacter freundii complex]|uniref:patatin-like phospholipase family protein n=1 Tax=Citrobacter freundii complex TaxID=1344959 RepID=UPI00292C4D1E|nr:patatin-like phospholipase family protein [Citrobacter portucalensis]MDV0512611.1 patatin-like phospholipase family protein [Citrobacter portucalensis]MDV0517134.1 patatin-like phospholipase family protein [Citrobacter portucalensis]MDV0562649.1 patatin-like phospholipase family protein [Citrobacter portucalensis]MEB0750589.1 patatin-like phospholipase family protein [Citrobacter portucalensis]MEB0761050.1 patatin-like phospholipase family protein [Citrobacter portucalensis]